MSNFLTGVNGTNPAPSRHLNESKSPDYTQILEGLPFAVVLHVHGIVRCTFKRLLPLFLTIVFSMWNHH